MILISKYPTDTESDFQKQNQSWNQILFFNYPTQNQQPNVLFMCGPQNGNWDIYMSLKKVIRTRG
jgi:hypothetical protein